MLIIVFSVLLFSAVSLAAYVFWTQMAANRDPVALRLSQLRAASSGSITFGERPPLLLDLIARLGGFMPARVGKDALRTGLVCAGYRRADAPFVFLGSKIVSAVLLPALYLAWALLAAHPFRDVPLMLLILGMAGFYLPSLYLGVRKRGRQDTILKALPDALDLMVVCVEAGLGMNAALHRVSGEIRLACRSLADELTIVHQEMQTGIPRAEALRNLAQRTGVDDIYSLVAMLIQTDRLGTSVAQALRCHAESMRTRRRQRAEQLARKASIKLAFPLVFLVLPALLVIILGPAAIELAKALTAQ